MGPTFTDYLLSMKLAGCILIPMFLAFVEAQRRLDDPSLIPLGSKEWITYVKSLGIGY